MGLDGTHFVRAYALATNSASFLRA
jgi:hypothetical protein